MYDYPDAINNVQPGFIYQDSSFKSKETLPANCHSPDIFTALTIALALTSYSLCDHCQFNKSYTLSISVVEFLIKNLLYCMCVTGLNKQQLFNPGVTQVSLLLVSVLEQPYTQDVASAHF